jgi:RND family efflux transporter MFP subunit
MTKNYPYLAILITVILLVSCGQEEKESRSIEQIYAEDGIPVKVETVRSKRFIKELSYNATLTGIQESSAYAHVDDKVEKIYVKVGDYVNKDDVLLVFPMDNLNANYHQAKVGFENAKKSYERIENLFKSGGISRQQLDNAKTIFEVAKANWDAAQQTVMVRAPISGYVTKVNVRETDNVKRDDELLTIARMNRMKAKVWVTEKEVNAVKKGLPAYAMWNNIRIEGEVVEVDMALNQQNQAFGAVVVFDNPDKILKFGIIVDVFIQTYLKTEAVVVEIKDLIREGDQYFAYIIENGIAVRRDLNLGERYRLDVEVLEGLDPGDQMVREGQMLLKDGAKVKIIE